MFKMGTVLDTPEKFGTAMVTQLHVAVYQQGELISFGGPIQDYSSIAVKINNSYFMIKSCEFRVR